MLQNESSLNEVEFPGIKTKVDNFYTGKMNTSDYIEIVPNKMFDVCELCGILSPDAEHYKSKHLDISGLLKCCLCLDETNDMFSYWDLVRHVTSNHELMFRCKYCRIRCCFKCELNEHFNAKHSELFICIICQSSQVNLKTMENHVIIHFLYDIFNELEIIETENLKCLDANCGHISENKVNLRNHFKNHYGKLEFVCECCTFGSNNRTEVMVHMKRYHNETLESLRKKSLKRKLETIIDLSM